MTIFLSFLQSPYQYPIPAYKFWEYYIKNGIEEAGHQWSECPDVDWALGLVSNDKNSIANWKHKAWSKTVAWLKKNPVDLFLSYLYPHMIDMAAIEEIKRLGIPCVNFYCDHLRDFKKLPVEFSVFSLNWVPEYKAISLYQKAGYPYLNLAMPIWVEPRYRVLQSEKNKQVTFIGSKDIQRQYFLEQIIQQSPDIPLAVYGNGWGENDAQKSVKGDYTIDKKLAHQFKFLTKQGIIPYFRKFWHQRYSTPISAVLKSKIYGVPDFEQYNELTSGSMIAIGINRYPSFHFPFSKPDSYSRLRDIEAPMLGACFLTEWTDGIDELYINGVEIETFKTAEEFIEKVRKLQADDQKRKSLKANGQKRALETHSIPFSLNRLFCALGL